MTQTHRFSKIYLLIHIALVLLPIIVLATWSVSASWSWPDLLPQELSNKGYLELLRPEHHTIHTIITSIGIAVCSAFISTLTATLAAQAFANHNFFGRRVFEFTCMLPLLIPSTVFAMGIQVAFIQLGLAKTIPGVILAHSIVSLPYAIVIMTDISISTGNTLEEAATIFGSRPLYTALNITVPNLLPGLISSFVMTYIVSFSQYFLTLLIGGGTIKTFALSMFPYLAGGDRTIASAYGMLFLGATFSVLIVLQLLLHHNRKR